MTVIRYGSKKLQRAVEKWKDDIIEDIKRVVVETAATIESTAKALAPVDSGYLRQSITVEIMDGGLKAKVTVDSEYAIFIEFGTGIYAANGDGRKDGWVYYNEKYGEYVYTKGSPAQPFWFPALKEGAKYFDREMAKVGG